MQDERAERRICIFHPTPGPHSHCHHHTLISTLSHYNIPLPSSHSHIHIFKLSYSTPHPAHILTAIITLSYPHSHTIIFITTKPSYSTPHPGHLLTGIIPLSYPHSHTIIFHPTPGPYTHWHNHTLISTDSLTRSYSTRSHYHIPPLYIPHYCWHYDTLTPTYSHSHINTLTLSYCIQHPAHILTGIITLSYPHSNTNIFHPTLGPHTH